MLTIITKDGIFEDPEMIFVAEPGFHGKEAIYVRPRAPTGLHMPAPGGWAITKPMTEKEAEAFYNHIADQVAAGVKVIDLRKMSNEEGEAK